MAAIGVELFRSVFQASADARDLWATLRSGLHDTRIEVVTEVREATAIPWELLRDPKTDTPLALRARAFVRAHPTAAQRPRLPKVAGPVRILLIICRPGGRQDVPFRSVAQRLIKGLGTSGPFQLDVLRPPTFEQLGQVLRAAKAAGRPYHVVHFDGHGTFESATSLGGGRMSAIRFADHRAGPHGYLLFENPAAKDNAEPVSGPALGSLLVETGAPVLVLNACRSAHAEPLEAPGQVAEPGAPAADDDPHAQVRAFGSLAQEVMDAGVAGVVAMRYNVYVVTAAQLVADLYAALARGQTLGEAVTLGRKQLAAQPRRDVTTAIDLQDWAVPVVYEAAPVRLFRKARAAPPLTISLHAQDASPGRQTLDPSLPPPPDVGFFGRDETLLALDRAFDSQPLVLLHALAGSGKTSTAAEFARWYALTGGVDGPVLFSSLEQYTPLARLLDVVGRLFGPLLERSGVAWLALTDAQRRDVALQLLRQVPVLWVWDNVEPVAGFPEGTPSAWSASEQQELADFLRELRTTKAKVLLTSRRPEWPWLGDLPARVMLPPMPMQERIQLVRTLAERYGSRIADVEDWRPLLSYTEGNPLTIRVLVRQALRDGLKTKAQIDGFVAKLRGGEDVIADDASEGRPRSLGASLSYGVGGFTAEERNRLALLHLFQGFVNVRVLRLMSDQNFVLSLPEVRDVTGEQWAALLDRAAEVGLLEAHGDGFYGVHPALPWYFKSLFDRAYPTPAPAGSESA